MTRLERLLMRVELIDKVTGPANKVAASFDRITKRAEAGFTSILKGGAGLVGTGYALNKLTSDAREMYNVISDVRSLNAADDVLARLEQRALSYSMTYGESATDFVRSAYAIQSGISSLVGDELVAFTEAGNVLAKATKADAEIITNYMGTMYAYFEETATRIGKSTWVDQMAGQTAMAIQIFKTSGKGMADAMSNVTASATNAGIAMSEQLAIVGNLQATMSSAAVAGSSYRSFIANLDKAQRALGMSFQDSHGKLLPLPDIMEKLEAQYGGLTTIERSGLFGRAFGKSAVPMLDALWGKTGQLREQIETLDNIKGMDNARLMAEAMVDPLDRLNATSTALRISFGKFLLKSLNPFYDRVSEGMGTLQRWTQMFPNLTGLIAKLTVGVFAFTAALSVLLILKGTYILTSLALGTAWTFLKFAMLPFRPLLTALRMGWVVLNMQLAAGAGIIPALRAAWVALRTQLLINTLAMWKLNAAFWANPITWIVGGIIALVGALVALAMYWDKVTASLGEAWSMIEDSPILSALFFPLMLTIKAVGWLLNGLKKLGSLVGLDKLFGGGGPDLPVEDGPASGFDTGAGPTVRANHVPPGGLMEQINNTSSRTTHIEKLEVNTNQSVNGYSLADELAMAAG